MSEIVLTAPFCDFSVVDSVYRTVVIAAETASAAAVVLPCGDAVEYDITYGALFCTSSAVGTFVGIDGELLVGNHITVEIGADDV